MTVFASFDVIFIRMLAAGDIKGRYKVKSCRRKSGYEIIEDLYSQSVKHQLI